MQQSEFNWWKQSKQCMKSIKDIITDFNKVNVFINKLTFLLFRQYTFKSSLTGKEGNEHNAHIQVLREEMSQSD